MPRNTDPSTLRRGGGLSAARSVEATSFVHPTQGLDGLIAHVTDPSRAHEAGAINLVDAGGYYASDDVEGALQEIASAGAYVGQSGVYQGCTFTATGLTATIDASSIVVVEGTGRDLSGESVVLPNNTVSWIYVTPAGVLSVLAGSSAPSMSSPENVLLWKVTTVAGAVTARVDVRWFVRNVHRKLPLLVRSEGASADATSEAAFATLEGAVEYLSQFGASGMRSTTIIVRGDITVEEPIVIPVDGLTIRGEGDATISTGQILTPMFDVSGRARFTLRDLAFSCENAGSTLAEASSAVSDILIERCRILSGAEDWVSAVLFSGGAQSRVVVRDTVVESVEYGISLSEPSESTVEGSSFTSVDPISSLVGVQFGPLSGSYGTAARNLVHECAVSGYITGIVVSCDLPTVSECLVTGATVSVQFGTAATRVSMSKCDLELDSSTGLTGIIVYGDHARITDCRITNARSSGSYGLSTPEGIRVVAAVEDVIINGCQISGFYNSANPRGRCISFTGNATDCVVSDCVLSVSDIGISFDGSGTRTRVAQTTVTEVRVGMALSDDVCVTGCSVVLDSSRGLTGISADGTGARVLGSRITNARSSGSYGLSDTPTGILLSSVEQVSIVGCDVLGFYNQTADIGSCVRVATSGTNISVSSSSLSGAKTAVDFQLATLSSVIGCSIEDFEVGIFLGMSDCRVDGCALSASATRGETGVYVGGDDVVVSNCQIAATRSVYAAEVPVGVSVAGDRASVIGCTIYGWTNTGGSLGAGVSAASPATEIRVEGSTIYDCWSGISNTVGSSESFTVAACHVRDTGGPGVAVDDCTGVSLIGSTFRANGTTSISASGCSGVVVQGCTVLGEGTTGTGISVQGSASSESRNVIVSACSVLNVADVGISISGYVRDALVTNCQVDCSVPGGGDPTATSCVEVVADGADVAARVTVSDCNLWMAQQGVVVEGASLANPCENVTVQKNTIHHCALATATAETCAAVSAQWALNLRVQENVVYSIGLLLGAADAETSPADAVDAFPVGLFLSQCDGASACQNQVYDLVPKGSGTSTGIRLDFANLAAPLDVRSLNVSSNEVKTADSLSPMTVGITATFGQSTGSGSALTVTGAKFTDNVVRRVRDQGILLTVSGEASLLQPVVSDNIVSQCTSTTLGYGIHVDVVGSGTFTDGILRNALISKNVLRDLGESGIAVLYDTGCTVTGVSISDCEVNSCSNRGIEVRGDLAPSSLNGIKIRGCLVQGSTNEAIYVVCGDADLSDVDVSWNRVSGLNGTASTGSGILIATATSAVTQNDLTRLTVRSNIVTLTGATALNISVNGILVGADIIGNELTVGSGASPLFIRLGQGSTLVSEVFTSQVLVANNVLRGGSFNTFAVEGGQKLQNIAVDGNLFYGTSSWGFYFSLIDATPGTGDALSNLSISRNQFSDTISTGLYVVLGGTALVDVCANVSLNGNLFSRCNTGGVTDTALLVHSFATVRNLSVSDNQFRSCGALDSTTSGILEIQFGSSSSPALACANLFRNRFMSCIGVGILVHDNTSAASFVVQGLSVCQNEVLNNSNDAVLVDLSASSSSLNVRVDENVIRNVSGTASDGGIHLVGSSTPLLNCSVSGNQISSVGNSGVSAILITSADSFTNLRVDNNQVDTTISSVHGIMVQTPNFWQSGSIHGNSVSNADGAGILVDLTGSTSSDGLFDVLISGNSIASCGDTGLLFEVDSGVSLSHTRVTGNVVNGPGSYGIFCNLGSGCDVDGLAIDANRITAPVLDGITILTSGVCTFNSISLSRNQVSDAGVNGIWYSSSSSPIITCSIDGNIVQSCGNKGIGVSSLSVLNVTMNGNVIRGWNDDASVNTTGLDFSVTDVQNVVVSGNSLRSASANSIGLQFVATGIVRTFCVSNNVCHLEAAASTKSMQFTGGGTQFNVSITGNSFRSATTGVTGTSLAPQFSVVAHNNERTSAGAGNWATFAALFTSSITSPNQD